MLFPLQVSQMSDTGVGREYAYRHTTVGPGVRGGWCACVLVRFPEMFQAERTVGFLNARAQNGS